MTSSLRHASALHDVRAIVRLGGPLLANNLAIAGMGFADTVMAGRLGARDLGAVAVGAAFYNLWFFVALGVLMALSPAVAHAWGAREEQRVAVYFRQSCWLAVVLACIVALGLMQARFVLTLVHVDPVLVLPASRYCQAIAWGAPAMTLFLALRFTSEGIGWTRPIMYIAIVGLAANVFGNWVFMYGRLGAPALGAVGCGVSSAIAIWIMAAGFLGYVATHRVYRPLALFARIDPPDRARLKELLGIGAPIAGSILSEGGLFAVAALMVGTFGATVVAAHQIALNYASFMFMVPLAIHSATTIHVGHLLGRRDRAGGRRAGFTGIILCGGVMAVSALGIVLWHDGIAALYTRDLAVRELAATLLLLAAVFQVSDGLQVGAAGALRGFKDTRVPMLLNLTAYWCIGFPIAWWLAIERGRGAAGVWIGFVVGLTVCAVLLGTRFNRISSRAVQLSPA